MTIAETAAPDLTLVKERQRQMWASGDFHAVATLVQPVADEVCQAAGLQAGRRVLDVACGSGNAAIAAARLGCEAVGVDYVPALHADLVALVHEHAGTGSGLVAIPATWLQAVAVRSGKRASDGM